MLITDENDCVPEFLQSIYSVDGVPETVTTATSLLQGKTLTLASHSKRKNNSKRKTNQVLNIIMSLGTEMSLQKYQNTIKLIILD